MGKKKQQKKTDKTKQQKKNKKGYAHLILKHDCQGFGCSHQHILNLSTSGNHELLQIQG